MVCPSGADNAILHAKSRLQIPNFYDDESREKRLHPCFFPATLSTSCFTAGDVVVDFEGDCFDFVPTVADLTDSVAALSWIGDRGRNFGVTFFVAGTNSSSETRDMYMRIVVGGAANFDSDFVLGDDSVLLGMMYCRRSTPVAL